MHSQTNLYRYPIAFKKLRQMAGSATKSIIFYRDGFILTQNNHPIRFSRLTIVNLVVQKSCCHYKVHHFWHIRILLIFFSIKNVSGGMLSAQIKRASSQANGYRVN